MANKADEVKRLERRIKELDSIVARSKFHVFKERARSKRIEVWQQYCELTNQSII